MLELSEKLLVAFSFAGEQRDFVRSIAEAVAKELGSTNVFFDEWFEHYIAGDDADLVLQKIYGERCALAVVCISERYGGKPWTLSEHAAIRARLMKARASSNPRDKLGILPIRVGDGDVEGILFNTIVPDVRERGIDGAAKLIIDRLGLIVPEPDQGSESSTGEAAFWPEALPSLRWQAANHSNVREAFSTLLTRNAPWRLLSLYGPSESGKSHITRQMVASALRLPDLGCGQFDFKGTTGMDAEVRAFVQELKVPAVPASPRLNERLSHILDALKQQQRPVLLIFDTYEAASAEAQDWVEKQLLPSIVRAPWLRVVVAGQRVPQHIGAVWEADAAPPIVLKSPQPADWFDYGKQNRPDLALADVEAVCRVVHNKASLISQALDPKI